MPLNRPIFRRSFTAGFLFLITLTALAAQETADSYFESVSERYVSIEDYTANLVIRRGETEEIAAVTYKNPGLLRLDYEDPAGMVMVVGPDLFQVWVPSLRVTFSQPLRRDGQSSGANLNTARGLAMMRQNYSVSYIESPDPVPLDDGSSEMVVWLSLRATVSEGFSRLRLAISSDLTIRRIIGVTTSGETITFDFTDMILNNGIPDTRFDYDSPPEGNTIENFLFDPES